MAHADQRQLPRFRSAASWLAIATSIGMHSCGAPEDLQPRELAVFVIDALRADALSCYSEEAFATEGLDAFARQAVRVERALAPASYTLASTASLFTGTSPARHGTLGLSTNVLPEACRTLAEALSDDGYATAAFSCNPNVSPPGAFDHWFGSFQFYLRDRLDVHVVPADLDAAVEAFWDEPAAPRRPRFSYVHVLPPHAPYDAPPEFLERVGATATTAEEGSHEHIDQLRRRERLSPQQPEVQRLRLRYLAGVQVADRWFSDLMSQLEPGLEQALVVVTSDHGESFAEHGFVSHGPSVYAEALEVPLLVRSPDLEPAVVPGPLSTQDLSATLTEALDVEWPQDGTAGRSFLSHLRGASAAPDHALLSRGTGERPFWSMRLGSRVLVEQPTGDYRALYDAQDDPQQRLDLRTVHPREADELSRRLAEELAAERSMRTERTGPRRHRVMARELAALGYTEESEEPAGNDGD